ncbi:MAG TPA: FAD-dependent oxidoreductase [Thermoleophilia bacterium]
MGNGAAAAEAALAIRGAGYRGDLDLFADNPHPPYNPMLGTYYASSVIPMEQCFPYGGPEFYDRHGIRAHLGTRVAGLDPVAKDLTTADGGRFDYRKCLVASGAASVFPPVPGLDSPGVLALRSFDDAVRLKNAVDALKAHAAAGHRPGRGLVLGASFAGLEVAAVLGKAGMDVCIVEREATVLPLVVLATLNEVDDHHLGPNGAT